MASLRLAVIINTDEPEPLRMMRESYISIFEQLAPGSTIDFFNGILDAELPVLATNKYDLLVIGGGTYVPSAEAPWVQRLVEFEKSLYTKHKEQKVVGICLGHQTSALTLGGTMCYLPEPEKLQPWHFTGEQLITFAQLAVTPITLTPAGQKFFKQTSQLHMHEYHRRAVDVLPPGFAPLAENNQILLSDNGNVVTFQGHPEMTSELMRALLMSPTSKASGYVNEEFHGSEDSEARRKLLDRAALDHDGMNIWDCLVNWVRQQPSLT